MSFHAVRHACHHRLSTSLSCFGNAHVRVAHQSTQASPAAASEDVIVTCRSNGEIRLNIFHPHNREDPTSPLILYLPTAPHAAGSLGVHDSQVIAALSASFDGTIVQLNYRAGGGVRYPTPVHDVLTGYDHVKKRFGAQSSTTRSGRVKKAPLHVGVCGQLVGGSLAAMLGLTESHLGQDRIAAVAINNPITDWIFPVTQQTVTDVWSQSTPNEQGEVGHKARTRCKKSAPSSSWEAHGHSSPASARSLEMIRQSLFKKPTDYLDPFASPVHFFRSPSVDMSPHLSRTTEDGEDPVDLFVAQTKARKAHRIFPPSNSTLVLPHFRLSAGTCNPLADANEEFVKLLRRSVARNALSKSSTQALLDRFEEEPTEEDARLEEAISQAEARVEYHIGGGSGFWGTEEEEQWMAEVQHVGRWFSGALKRRD